jgi:hypothetical protein
MAVAIDICPDLHGFADHAFDRESSFVNSRIDVLDAKSIATPE